MAARHAGLTQLCGAPPGDEASLISSYPEREALASNATALQLPQAPSDRVTPGDSQSRKIDR